jgi:hypothetical protein
MFKGIGERGFEYGNCTRSGDSNFATSKSERDYTQLASVGQLNLLADLADFMGDDGPHTKSSNFRYLGGGGEGFGVVDYGEGAVLLKGVDQDFFICVNERVAFPKQLLEEMLAGCFYIRCGPLGGYIV